MLVVIGHWGRHSCGTNSGNQGVATLTGEQACCEKECSGRIRPEKVKLQQLKTEKSHLRFSVGECLNDDRRFTKSLRKKQAPNGCGCQTRAYLMLLFRQKLSSRSKRDPRQHFLRGVI
jgi:hypothetical protein